MSTPVGRLRNKLYLIQFQNQVADGYGGQSAGSIATKRTFWGDVTETSGNRVEDAGQQVFSKTYLIKARYSSTSKVENGNYTIYDGKVLVINGIINTDYNKFIEITAVQREVGNDAAASLPGTFEVYDHTAEGGESEFTAADLINKDVLLVFEEGSAMSVDDLDTGRLQVQYIAGTGKIKFDHLLQEGERIQVMYQ